MRKSSLILQVAPEHNPARHPLPKLCYKNGLWHCRFDAMASECEVLIEGSQTETIEHFCRMAVIETWRIEYKYSRYRQDNVMAAINHSAGEPVEIDSETHALFEFANQCYQLSDGLFDISSGVLRKIWRFDGSDKVPSHNEIASLLPSIGWRKVERYTNQQRTMIILPKGMELDLGGIGKEYAVDRALFLVQQHIERNGLSESHRVLLNYGGDLACSGPRINGEPWQVAVESIHANHKAAAKVLLSHGAVATSGDANRYLLKDGVRYSHVLNPKTGCSVTDAPHAVSVAGANCMQAGMLSTIASLYGVDAEAFLEAQGLEYWVQR